MMDVMSLDKTRTHRHSFDDEHSVGRSLNF